MAGQSSQSTLKPAALIQLMVGKNGTDPVEGSNQVAVQFNPQTLKLTYDNENKSANQPAGSAAQFIGANSSKLSVELLFDTTQTGQDVRATTRKVAQFIRPAPPSGNRSGAQQKRVPPSCRFQWGTFQFDGVIDSLQETLDYFSEDGVALRSTLALSISGLEPIKPDNASNGSPGTSPQTQAPANSSLPQLAGANGNSSDWPAIAAANNIDDPLHLPAGTMIDMSVDGSGGAGVSNGGGADAGFSAGLGAGIGFAAGASVGASAGVGASASIGASASAGAGASIGASIGGGANLGVGASTGVSASAGLGLSAGIAASAGIGVQASAAIGTRTSAAGTMGGSFGVSASASATI